MKTIDSLRQLIPGLAGLISVITMTSCQTTSTPPDATRVAMSSAAAKWVMVSSQPPTYYPRGVPADCPTDHWSGEWVITGDERGTRYFIPLHGLDGKRQALVHDALAARSPRKLAQIADEERATRLKTIKYSPVLVPMNLLLAMGGASSGVDEAMLERAVEEIKETWREADSTPAPRGFQVASN